MNNLKHKWHFGQLWQHLWWCLWIWDQSDQNSRQFYKIEKLLLSTRICLEYKEEEFISTKELKFGPDQLRLFIKIIIRMLLLLLIGEQMEVSSKILKLVCYILFCYTSFATLVCYISIILLKIFLNQSSLWCCCYTSWTWTSITNWLSSWGILEKFFNKLIYLLSQYIWFYLF